MLKKVTFLAAIVSFNTAFAVTDAEVRELIRNTPITGEGSQSESHGYDESNVGSISDKYEAPSWKNKSNISADGIKAILKSPRRVWNYNMSNANYAFGRGNEQVTIYVAFNEGRGGRVKLQLAYFTTIRSAAAIFHDQMRKVPRTQDQLKAGWELIKLYGMPLLP